jgi:hypothetical protein
MAKKKSAPLEKGPAAVPSGKKVGRPKTPEELKVLRAQNKQEMEMIIHRVMDMSREELKRRMDDPRTSSLELMVIQIAVKAITNGDYSRMNALLYWVFGKPTENVQLSGVDGEAIQIEQKPTSLEEQMSGLSDAALAKLVAGLKKGKNAKNDTTEE